MCFLGGEFEGSLRDPLRYKYSYILSLLYNIESPIYKVSDTNTGSGGLLLTCSILKQWGSST